MSAPWRIRFGALAMLLALGMVLGGCDLGGSDDSDGSEAAKEREEETVDEEALKEGDVEPREFELEEVDGSGIFGTASVGPGEDGAIEVEIELEGEFDDTHGAEARMASCDDPGSSGSAGDLLEGATAYTLADVEDGTMRDEAKLPDELVSKGTYSLVVYEGADVDGEVAACAEVEVE